MTLITDLHYLFSTDPSDFNRELKEMGARVGVPKELLYCHEGRYFLPLSKRKAQKMLIYSRTGEVVIFDRKRVMKWILRGVMPKITRDAKGRVLRQLI